MSREEPRDTIILVDISPSELEEEIVTSGRVEIIMSIPIGPVVGIMFMREWAEDKSVVTNCSCRVRVIIAHTEDQTDVLSIAFIAGFYRSNGLGGGWLDNDSG